MNKPKLSIACAELDIESLRQSLGLTYDEVVEKFSDARVTSWFAEIWGERIFGYGRHLSANHPGSDGAVAFGEFGQIKVGVRCFRRNTLKFQKSVDIGAGRSSSKERLKQALMEVDRYVIVDLRFIPKLRFLPLDTKYLIDLVSDDRLTISGISPSRFDVWLEQQFELEEYSIELLAPDR